MKRRDFITLVDGATAAMSTAAYGQLSLPIVGVAQVDEFAFDSSASRLRGRKK